MGAEFHYQRTPFDEGGVARVEGAPGGTRLARILEQGLPPIRVGLELVAAFCEIVYIAHDDGVVHGDIGLDHVWLTGDGIVSIAGYGVSRATTRAPERRPVGPDTDLYGLGRVAAAVLTTGHEELDRAPRASANDHDDAIADFVMGADLGQLEESTLNDVRWFLLYLMAFDHKDRPDPLRAWRSFIAFARTVEGPDLIAWAEDAVQGRGARRRATNVRPKERLEGPTAHAGPLTSAISFSETGGRTLFWSPKDDGPALAEPKQGSGAGTGHWSRAELAAMAREAADAPRPARARQAAPEHGIPETSGTMWFDPGDPEAHHANRARRAAPAPAPQPVPPAPVVTPPATPTVLPPVTQRAPPPPPVVQAPVVRGPTPPPRAEPQGLARYSTGVLVLLGFGVAMFVLALIALTAAVVWWAAS